MEKLSLVGSTPSTSPSAVDPERVTATRNIGQFKARLNELFVGRPIQVNKPTLKDWHDLAGNIIALATGKAYTAPETYTYGAFNRLIEVVLARLRSPEFRIDSSALLLTLSSSSSRIFLPPSASLPPMIAPPLSQNSVPITSASSVEGNPSAFGTPPSVTPPPQVALVAPTAAPSAKQLAEELKVKLNSLLLPKGQQITDGNLNQKGWYDLARAILPEPKPPEFPEVPALAIYKPLMPGILQAALTAANALTVESGQGFVTQFTTGNPGIGPGFTLGNVPAPSGAVRPTVVATEASAPPLVKPQVPTQITPSALVLTEVQEVKFDLYGETSKREVRKFLFNQEEATQRFDRVELAFGQMAEWYTKLKLLDPTIHRHRYNPREFKPEVLQGLTELPGFLGDIQGLLEQKLTEATQDPSTTVDTTSRLRGVIAGLTIFKESVTELTSALESITEQFAAPSETPTPQAEKKNPTKEDEEEKAAVAFDTLIRRNLGSTLGATLAKMKRVVQENPEGATPPMPPPKVKGRAKASRRPSLPSSATPSEGTPTPPVIEKEKQALGEPKAPQQPHEASGLGAVASPESLAPQTKAVPPPPPLPPPPPPSAPPDLVARRIAERMPENTAWFRKAIATYQAKLPTTVLPLVLPTVTEVVTPAVPEKQKGVPTPSVPALPLPLPALPSFLILPNFTEHPQQVSNRTKIAGLAQQISEVLTHFNPEAPNPEQAAFALLDLVEQLRPEFGSNIAEFSAEFKKIQQFATDLVKDHLVKALHENTPLPFNFFANWHRLRVLETILIKDQAFYALCLKNLKAASLPLIRDYHLKNRDFFRWPDFKNLGRDTYSLLTPGDTGSTAAIAEARGTITNQLLEDCFQKYQALQQHRPTPDPEAAKLLDFAAGLLSQTHQTNFTAAGSYIVNGYIQIPWPQDENKEPFKAFITAVAQRLTSKNAQKQTVLTYSQLIEISATGNLFLAQSKADLPAQIVPQRPSVPTASPPQVEAPALPPIPGLPVARATELFNLVTNPGRFREAFGVSNISIETGELTPASDPAVRTQLFTDLQLLWQQLPVWGDYLLNQVADRLSKIAFFETAENILPVEGRPDLRALTWLINFPANPDFLAALNSKLQARGVNLQQQREGFLLVKTSCLGPGKIGHGDNTCYLATFLGLAYESPYFARALALNEHEAAQFEAGRTFLPAFRQAVFSAHFARLSDFAFKDKNQMKPLEEIDFDHLPRTPEFALKIAEIQARQTMFLERFIFYDLLSQEDQLKTPPHSPEKTTALQVLTELRRIRTDRDERHLDFDPVASQAILDRLRPLPEFAYMGQFLALGEPNPRSISHFFRDRLQEAKATITGLAEFRQQIKAQLQIKPGTRQDYDNQAKQENMLKNLAILQDLDPAIPITPQLLKQIKEFRNSLREIPDPRLAALKAAVEKLVLWNEVYQEPVTSALFQIYKDTCTAVAWPEAKRYISALVHKLGQGNTVTVFEMNQLDTLLQQAKIFPHVDYNMEDPADLITFIETHDPNHALGEMQRTDEITIPDVTTPVNSRIQKPFKFSVDEALTFTVAEKGTDLFQLMHRAFVSELEELEFYNHAGTLYAKETGNPATKRTMVKVSALPEEIMFRVAANFGVSGQAVQKLVDLKPFIDFGPYFEHPAPHIYELTKVLVHQPGHWFSYVKKGEQWFRVDDVADQTREASFEEVQEYAAQYAANLVFQAFVPGPGKEAKAAAANLQSLRQRAYLGQIPAAAPETPQPLIQPFDFTVPKTAIMAKLANLAQAQFVRSQFTKATLSAAVYAQDQKINRLRAELRRLFNQLEAQLNDYYVRIVGEGLNTPLNEANLASLKSLEEQVNQLHCDVMLSLQGDITGAAEILAKQDPAQFELLGRYLRLVSLYKDACQANLDRGVASLAKIAGTKLNVPSQAYNSALDLMALTDPTVLFDRKKLEAHLQALRNELAKFRFPAEDKRQLVIGIMISELDEMGFKSTLPPPPPPRPTPPPPPPLPPKKPAAPPSVKPSVSAPPSSGLATANPLSSAQAPRLPQVEQRLATSPLSPSAPTGSIIAPPPSLIASSTPTPAKKPPAPTLGSPTSSALVASKPSIVPVPQKAESDDDEEEDDASLASETDNEENLGGPDEAAIEAAFTETPGKPKANAPQAEATPALDQEHRLELAKRAYIHAQGEATHGAYFQKQLTAYFADKNKTIGTAIDNGDCFYDSMAQAINSLPEGVRPANPIRPGQAFTIKDLRMICARYATEDPAPAWLKTYIERERGGLETFADYKAKVGFTQEELDARRSQNPSDSQYAPWGRHNIEGQIIAATLGLQIRLTEVDLNPVDFDHLAPTDAWNSRPEESLLQFQDIPRDLSHTPIVEIAIYPGHYMPVLAK